MLTRYRIVASDGKFYPQQLCRTLFGMRWRYISSPRLIGGEVLYETDRFATRAEAHDFILNMMAAENAKLRAVRQRQRPAPISRRP